MNTTSQSVSITLKKISKFFGKTKVIEDLDISFQAGTLTTLLGPSGCGKTTLLRLVSGLEAPTSGEIWFGDEDVSKLSATNRDVGMVFQSYALFPHMTVEKNVGFGLEVIKMAKDEIRENVRQSLQRVGLDGYQKRFPDELSGGQQQRVAVARALVLQPKVLLFDEPLSNIDSKLRRSMREDIRKLQQDTGITSIYVTHDQAEALAVSDEVVVMNNGKIEQQGPPRDLYQKPKSSFVANFIGESNVVTGTVMKSDSEEISIQLGEAEITLPNCIEGIVSETIKLSLRPEMFKLLKERSSSSDLSGTIIQASYMGPVVEYNIETVVGVIFTTASASEEFFQRGQSVYLNLNPKELIIIPDGDVTS